MDQHHNYTQLAAEIVAAYVGHNPVNMTELPNLIQQTLAALTSTDASELAVEKEPQKPAVPIKRSLAPEHITCLEDGKRFKSLKRHLRTDHDLLPQE